MIATTLSILHFSKKKKKFSLQIQRSAVIIDVPFGMKFDFGVDVECTESIWLGTHIIVSFHWKGPVKLLNLIWSQNYPPNVAEKLPV